MMGRAKTERPAMIFDDDGGLLPQPRLVRLSHVSEAAAPMGADVLLEIGSDAHRHNHRLGVTGFLLYLDGAIFQVLEGAEAAVEASLARISGDARICETTPLLRERPLWRRFRGWSLGALDLPFESLPANVFFKAEWDQIRRRVCAIGRPAFYRILERFYEVNHNQGQDGAEPMRRAFGG